MKINKGRNREIKAIGNRKTGALLLARRSLKATPSGDNIQTKSDLGNVTMNYGANNKPHALASLSGVPANFPAGNLSVTYTDFKKIETLTEGNKFYQVMYGVDDQRRKSVYADDDQYETRYYIGDYEEKINDLTGTVQKIHYLPGAIYIENSDGTANFYYAYTDILGSLTALVNENGTVAERYSYDPWGKRHDPDNWTLPDSRTNLITNRGYTGHEHIDQFGIINMNGRVYDPLTASFFSPDPYVQAPDNWLNYNRYSYCLNNPFKYVDPTGEIFGTIFGFISDLFNNVFVRNSKGEKWDWTQTELGWEIDKGLFHTDPNKSTGGRIWEFVSRLTWRLPQTLAGDFFVSGANAFGQVNDVTHGYGATAVDMGLDGGAVTIGNYTAGPHGYKADWRDHLFVHEYGHYIQSQQHGPVYLFTVGIPGLQSTILQTNNPDTPRHHDRWFEADASYKGMAYFDKHYGSGKDGYVAGSSDYFDRNSFINGTRMPYANPRTGLRYDNAYSISGKFHWTDIPIYIPVIGLFPYLFY